MIPWMLLSLVALSYGATLYNQPLEGRGWHVVAGIALGVAGLVGLGICVAAIFQEVLS